MTRSLIPFVIQEVDGDVVVGANVLISKRSGGAAQVFSAETGSAELSNPVETNANGRIPGWLEEGSYTIMVSGGNLTTYTRSLEIYTGAGTSNISDGSITNAKITDAQITTAKIIDGAVSSAKIAAGQITNGKIATDAISTRTLADNQADEQSFATDSVTTAKVADGAVTAQNLTATTVATANLTDNSVPNSALAASSVNTAEIQDGAVTSAKFEDKAISQSAHIGNGAIGLDHLQPSVFPVGVIMSAANAIAPPGWALCDGSAISRTTYPLLFALLGTQYGAGDGSTTFNLPDIRGRQLIGRAPGGHGNVDAVGDHEGGEAIGVRKPDHAHSIGGAYLGSGSHNHQYLASSGDCSTFSIVNQYETFQGYYGNTLAVSFASGFGGSAHGHSLSGYVGRGGTVGANHNGFLVVNHFVKLDPKPTLLRGNFETGDFSQFVNLQAVARAGTAVGTSSPAPAQGTYRARFEVQDGDNIAGGERAEVVGPTFNNDQKVQIHFKLYIATGQFPSDGFWRILMQIHQFSDAGSPPVALHWLPTSQTFRLANGANNITDWQAAGNPARDTWHDFIFNMCISDNPSNGYMEVIYNDVQQTMTGGGTRKFRATGDQGSYFKCGLYRDPLISTTEHIFFDDVWIKQA